MHVNIVDMKKLQYYTAVTLILSWVLTMCSCNKSFLEKGSLGTLNETTLSTKAGINQLLIGAYNGLKQNGLWPGAAYYSSVDYYIFSGVASDEGHAATFGNLPDMEQFEAYKETPVNSVLEIKWGNLYAAIQRANDVLRLLPKVKDLTESEATQIKAEAIFLRAFFHFQAAKIWENVPYISDSINFDNGNYLVPNTTPVWPKIEADFKFAMDNLTPTKTEAGRPNSWAAKSFLAAVYMFEHKYNEAKPLLEDIIANGVTSSGEKYALINYPDNFNNPSTENNAESIFAVQFTANDGSGGANGNAGDVLNQPMVPGYGGGGTFQPSFSLVNSFKTDPSTGLPLIYNFNDTDMKNDQGLQASDPFTPYTGTVDPRLDWTVSRRGLPTLDWGIFGRYWVYDQSIGGPYGSRKTLIPKADESSRSSYGGWIYSSNLNRELMRFARILLFAAEVEVETGSLDKAEMYVNRVRERAADPAGWVHTYVDNDDPSKGFTDVPAANYKIGLYHGEFTAKGQAFARDAVHFEEKIELAMEGFRFFDLRRWDNGTGSMAETLNAYLQHETHIPNFNYTNCNDAKFIKGKDEIYPIPQQEIDRSVKDGESVLKQNPNW
jgi:hypothetical protein